MRVTVRKKKRAQTKKKKKVNCKHLHHIQLHVQMAFLRPIYVLNKSIKDASGNEIKTLSNGSTTIYASPVLSPPKNADGSAGTPNALCSYKSDFKIEFDRIPFNARPAFLLTKEPDATTPVEFVINLTKEQYAVIKAFDEDLLSETATILAGMTKLPCESKSSIVPSKKLSDGRDIEASMTARIKGWSQYMKDGTPRVIGGASFPGDPTWSDVPTTVALAKNSTIFYMKGPASVGGAWARTARPNRHLGPQDVRPNAVSGTAYVYVSHVWVRTVKNHSAVQYGVTYAIAAMYMEPRASTIQSNPNPMGVRMYDPNVDDASNTFNAGSGPAGRGYSECMAEEEEYMPHEQPSSPPRPGKRARTETTK